MVLISVGAVTADMIIKTAERCTALVDIIISNNIRLAYRIILNPVCKSAHQPRGTCQNEFLSSDLAEVLPWHCIYLTNRFTSYKFTNHSHNLQVNHVLHSLNANGMNSRPKYYHQV